MSLLQSLWNTGETKGPLWTIRQKRSVEMPRKKKIILRELFWEMVNTSFFCHRLCMILGREQLPSAAVPFLFSIPGLGALQGRKGTYILQSLYLKAWKILKVFWKRIHKWVSLKAKNPQIGSSLVSDTHYTVKKPWAHPLISVSFSFHAQQEQQILPQWIIVV